MAKAAWIQALLQRRPIWLAGVAVLLLLLLGSVAFSQRDWHNRALGLERENLSLQLAQLGRELTAQSEQLAERTRELADSDAVIRLVQETTDPSADRLELADESRRSLDALLVLSASRAVRFSVTVTDGQLSEQPPEPALMQLVESLAASSETMNRGSQLMTFGDDRWLVVRPVIGHASPAVMGWVAASRALSPALISQLAKSVGGTLSVQPTQALDSAALKADGGFGITTQLSKNDASGFAVLHDAGGHAVRVLRLARAEFFGERCGNSLGAPEQSGGHGVTCSPECSCCWRSSASSASRCGAIFAISVQWTRATRRSSIRPTTASSSSTRIPTKCCTPTPLFSAVSAIPTRKRSR